MMTTTPAADAATPIPTAEPSFGLIDLVDVLEANWKQLLIVPIVVALLAYGITWLVRPVFTARTAFLPPVQQASGGAAAALSALGPLAALAGASALTRTPADQYISILRSTTVSDRMIERFGLLEVYDERTRTEARKVLARRVTMVAGKRDGIITVDVDDTDPKRAADMANEYVDELRLMSNKLALTEAQQRRVFFEAQLVQTRDNLAKAQIALQESGFNPGAIKSEPRAAVEGYAKLRAELTSAEVRLQAFRQTFVDGAPELQQQQAIVAALRAQLAKLEQATDQAGGANYVTKYREYRYQETLFELFARQYETARVDEAREGGLIQVIDRALPPEKKSRPVRSLVAGAAWLAALLLTAGWLVFRNLSSRRRRARVSVPAG
jgi:uncharacterized protein involved in exopolysaccharide biosynthesis